MPPRPYRPILVIASAILAMGLGGFLLNQRKERAATPEPPRITAVGVDPSVKAALEAAREDILKSPASGERWGRLGMLFLAHDYLADAATCFLEAERVDPTQADWPVFLGLTTVNTDPARSIIAFRKALEREDRNSIDLRLKLADALSGLEQWDEAEAQYSEVIRRNASNPRALLGLGRIAVRRGKPADGTRLLESAARDPKTRKAALILLAQSHQMLGHREDALRCSREAEAAPDDEPWPDPWWSRVIGLRTGKSAELEEARKLFLENRVREGLSIVERFTQTHPKESYAWYMLGKARYQTREWVLAERAFRKALELEPRSVQARFLLGVVLGEQGQVDAAIQQFRTAIDITPGFALSHYNLGLCLARKNDAPGATAAMRSAIGADPGMAKAHAALAELLMQAGQRDEALAPAREAVRLRPEDASARRLLSNLEGAIPSNERPGAPASPPHPAP